MLLWEWIGTEKSAEQQQEDGKNDSKRQTINSIENDQSFLRIIIFIAWKCAHTHTHTPRIRKHRMHENKDTTKRRSENLAVYCWMHEFHLHHTQMNCIICVTHHTLNMPYRGEEKEEQQLWARETKFSLGRCHHNCWVDDSKCESSVCLT